MSAARPPQPLGPEAMTAADVAALFRVDSRTVGRWAKAGRLTRGPKRRHGYEYSRREVEELYARSQS